MIYGHGVDVLGMDRVRQAWDKMGYVFASRILGNQELKALRALVDSDREVGLNYLAKRFAAKEALFKALGTGITGSTYDWQNAELLNDDLGKPYFQFHNNLAILLENKPVFVSVSDHSDVVIGSVIIESN